MKVCQICKKNKCKELIDFGNHPVCHKFSDGKQKEEKFSLALGQCQFCGLVQLMSPIPPDKLIPSYDWIKYNEPEEHLDHLAKIITRLPGINKQACVGECINMPFLASSINRSFFHLGNCRMISIKNTHKSDTLSTHVSFFFIVSLSL